MNLPFVTIIMPIRNEANFIGRSLGAVLAQDYPPSKTEIIIVDGMSTDDTREVIRRVLSNSTFPSSAVKILDNPAHIVPTALNIGLQHAGGDIIIRVDGHCEIAPNYVRRCVEVLEKTGADCVGGPIKSIGNTLTAQSISLAQSSHFGVGGVAFRTKYKRGGYVDTVAFGAYRRDVFERIGGFDEELVRNQDDEFNFRLIQAGGKIWLDPSIRSVYYNRASLRSLWRQYFQYGFYKVRVIQKRGEVPSWRHLVPASFVLGLAMSILMAVLVQQVFWCGIVAGPYLIANLIASFWTARRNWQTLPLLPATFATIHLAYGIGFLWGVWHWRNFWKTDSKIKFGGPQNVK